eukprot:6376654-Pyramimonas_sp.AAC.1
MAPRRAPNDKGKVGPEDTDKEQHEKITRPIWRTSPIPARDAKPLPATPPSSGASQRRPRSPQRPHPPRSSAKRFERWGKPNRETAVIKCAAAT